MAAILAFTAGAVNAIGYFAFSTLVTNVTGHFALISHESNEGKWIAAIEAARWVGAFCAGSFASTTLILIARRRGVVRAYATPLLLEIVVLASCLTIASRTSLDPTTFARLLTSALLFAMGLQNAAMTVSSGSVVRTTHLTGSLTDLGVNLSRVLFDRDARERGVALRRVVLDMEIVLSFALGAYVGGRTFRHVGFPSLWIPIATLTLVLALSRWSRASHA